MSKIVVGWLALLWMLSLPTCSEPSPTPRGAVQAAYDKAALGARLKFVFGMLSHRTADFELFGPDGRKLDLTLERQRFKQLFEPATRVNLTTKIVYFEARANRAECRVEQTMQIEAPDKENNKTVTTSITTYLADSWQRQATTWKLRSSHVFYQSSGQRDGPIEKK